MNTMAQYDYPRLIKPGQDGFQFNSVNFPTIIYHQTSDINPTLMGIKTADHLDVGGAWPAVDHPTTFSLSN